MCFELLLLIESGSQKQNCLRKLRFTTRMVVLESTPPRSGLLLLVDSTASVSDVCGIRRFGTIAERIWPTDECELKAALSNGRPKSQPKWVLCHRFPKVKRQSSLLQIHRRWKTTLLLPLRMKICQMSTIQMQVSAPRKTNHIVAAVATLSRNSVVIGWQYQKCRTRHRPHSYECTHFNKTLDFI